MSNIKTNDVIEYLGNLEDNLRKSDIVKNLMDKETYTKDEVMTMIQITACASYVNLTLESLTEALTTLADEGVIE